MYPASRSWGPRGEADGGKDVTISIDDQQRQRASQSPADHPGRGWPRHEVIVWGARGFAVLTTLAGAILAVADLAGDASVHLIAPAATSFMLAGMASVVLCVHAMLADRQEYYRRGQLDGWMRGWRGQEPDVDDPLLR
jgi:hypothetical protein